MPAKLLFADTQTVQAHKHTIYAHVPLLPLPTVCSVEVLCIDGFTRQSKLKHLQVIAAIEHLVWKKPLHDEPESSESNPGNQRERANNSCAYDGSCDHRDDAWFRDCKRWFVPRNFGSRLNLAQ